MSYENNKEYFRRYCREHKEQRKINAKKCIDRRKANDPERHRQMINANMRRYRASLKYEVLTHYGGGKLICVTCGESRMPCLSIDHMNGGGRKHRQKLTTSLYHWLRNGGYPAGYQTLCMNCQWMKRAENKE